MSMSLRILHPDFPCLRHHLLLKEGRPDPCSQYPVPPVGPFLAAIALEEAGSSIHMGGTVPSADWHRMGPSADLCFLDFDLRLGLDKRFLPEQFAASSWGTAAEGTAAEAGSANRTRLEEPRLVGVESSTADGAPAGTSAVDFARLRFLNPGSSGPADSATDLAESAGTEVCSCSIAHQIDQAGNEVDNCTAAASTDHKHYSEIVEDTGIHIASEVRTA